MTCPIYLAKIFLTRSGFQFYQLGSLSSPSLINLPVNSLMTPSLIRSARIWTSFSITATTGYMKSLYINVAIRATRFFESKRHRLARQNERVGVGKYAVIYTL